MAHAPQRTFFGSDGFFLSLDTRFFVMFPFTQLGQNAGFFAQLLKAPNSAFNGFVFANSNSSHKLKSPPILPWPLYQR
jgi:hypothetical protein